VAAYPPRAEGHQFVLKYYNRSFAREIKVKSTNYRIQNTPVWITSANQHISTSPHHHSFL
jgi:hypothetical protein